MELKAQHGSNILPGKRTSLQAEFVFPVVQHGDRFLQGDRIRDRQLFACKGFDVQEEKRDAFQLAFHEVILFRDPDVIAELQRVVEENDQSRRDVGKQRPLRKKRDSEHGDGGGEEDQQLPLVDSPDQRNGNNPEDEGNEIRDPDNDPPALDGYVELDGDFLDRPFQEETRQRPKSKDDDRFQYLNFILLHVLKFKVLN